ncbi:AAA family ATPase [Candidatus Poriferisodalis sp.]|uniref:AAA family ATPase n=1 Tax=Candidatus Poriferisodalis sp. TaxID=3101277 RepID=UPI003C6F4B4E
MAASTNPFTPGFGASPPTLAGRDGVMASIETALTSPSSHPASAQIIVGFRGAGKTAVLNAAQEAAQARKWAVIKHDASIGGWLDDITAMSLNLLPETQSGRIFRRVSGVQVAGTGVHISTEGQRTEDARLLFVMQELCESMAKRNSGLLISIDEFHSADADSLREFGAVLQLLRRDGYRVVFLGAALPHIEDLLAEHSVPTFLQRMNRQTVAQLDQPAAQSALRRPLVDRGVHVSADAIRIAASATGGHPYMIQLVGFHAWEHARQPDREITVDDLRAGIATAENTIVTHLFEPMWRSLSDKDREFAIAMSQDDSESKLGTLADRCHVSSNYAGVYRQRLIDAGIAAPSRHGYLRFAQPVMRDWIRTRRVEGGTEPGSG